MRVNPNPGFILKGSGAIKVALTPIRVVCQNTLRKKKLTDKQVMDYIEILLTIEDGSTPQQVRNMKQLQEDMKLRYFKDCGGKSID